MKRKIILYFVVVVLLVSLLTGCNGNGVVPPPLPPEVPPLEDYVGVWKVIDNCTLNSAEIWLQVVDGDNKKLFVVERFLGFGLCQGVGGTGSTTSLYIFKEGLDLFEDPNNIPDKSCTIDSEGRIVTVDEVSWMSFLLRIYELTEGQLKITRKSFDVFDGEIFFDPYQASDFYEKIGDIPKKGRY